jgi:hypothetical protein
LGCLIQNAAVRVHDRFAVLLTEGLVGWLTAFRLVGCQNGWQIDVSTGGPAKHVADC